MALKLYNTMSKQKDQFVPVVPGKVRMYNCGPTVYDYATIGNLSAYIMADLLRRYFEYSGFEVKQVMNITDVGHLTSDADEGEDKIEVGARREGKSPWEIAEFYTQAFMEDIAKLNIQTPHIICHATDHIADMIALIEKLFQNGYAYQITDGVYYNVQKFKDYGKLSGNTLEKLKAGARIEVNPEKYHPADFALWKLNQPTHIMQWDSPWGRGFPGWHIECSAMSMKYLGDTLDIHTGGEDNIFPHHECEIAQSEGATGKKFVNHWVHRRHLLVNGQKMAKSLGNFYILRDITEQGFDPLAFRYLVLSAHYRAQLNFTWAGLKGAESALDGLRQFVTRLDVDRSYAEARKLTIQAEEDFVTAMNDDLNTPIALRVIFDLVKEVNKLGVGGKEVYELLMGFDKVLGLDLDRVRCASYEEKLPPEILQLIEERERARQRNEWARADAIRAQLAERGIKLEDTPAGVRWIKKEDDKKTK